MVAFRHQPVHPHRMNGYFYILGILECMIEKIPTSESSYEKILTREEVLSQLLEYAGTEEYEIIGESKDSAGLLLLEIEIKDPNSSGYFVISYVREKASDAYRKGATETAIHYWTRDENHIEDGGGSSIAKFVNEEWRKTDHAPWMI